MTNLSLCVYSPKKYLPNNELPVVLPDRLRSTLPLWPPSKVRPLPKLSTSTSAPALSKPSLTAKRTKTVPSQELGQSLENFLPAVQSLSQDFLQWDPESHAAKYQQTFANMHQTLVKNQNKQRSIFGERLRIRTLENCERIRGSSVLRYLGGLPEPTDSVFLEESEEEGEGLLNPAAQRVVNMSLRHGASMKDLPLLEVHEPTAKPGQDVGTSKPIMHNTPDKSTHGALTEAANVESSCQGSPPSTPVLGLGKFIASSSRKAPHRRDRPLRSLGSIGTSDAHSAPSVSAGSRQLQHANSQKLSSHGHGHGHDHPHGHGQGHGHGHPHGHRHIHEKGHRNENKPDQIDEPFDASMEWHQAFAKFQFEGEVHADKLLKALEFCGEEYPNKEWTSKTLPTITKQKTLDKDEFFEFLKGYDACKRKWFEEQFRKYDIDGSGQISVNEMEQVISDAGITVLEDVLTEVINEVDHNGSGDLDFNEFVSLMKILHERRGFLSAEIEELKEVFNKFDRHKRHQISSQELTKLCKWAGFWLEESDHQRIKEADADHSGTLNFSEFLVFMRIKRERETVITRKLIKKYPNVSDLTNLLRELGYDFLPGFPVALAEELGLSLGPLTLEDAWKVLRAVRKQEGFLQKEVNELQEVFNAVDTDHSGEVDAIELGGALRTVLGFSMDLDAQQDLVECVDVDDSGKLDFREFLKLFRMFRETELAAVQQKFRKAGAQGTLSVEVLYSVLYRLGYAPTPGMIKPLLKGREQKLDLGAFLKLLHEFRVLACEHLQQNAGFNDSDVRKLRPIFMKYASDKDGVVDVGGRELGKLVEEIVPASVHDAKVHDRISRELAQVDRDKDGRISFEEFLQLVRMEEDIRRGEALRKEKRSAQKLGYGRPEVKELRNIFQSRAEHKGIKGTLSKAGCVKLIGDIVGNLKDKNQLELLNHFSAADQDEDGLLDFPEFMTLIKRLQENNFLNINDFRIAGGNQNAQPRRSSKRPGEPQGRKPSVGKG